MITVSDIISAVQIEIGDIAGDRVQPAEWVDMFNRIARQVAQNTEVWMDRFTLIPNPLVGDWNNNQNYTQGQFIEESGSYYVAVDSHISNTGGVFADDSAHWTEVNAWTDGTSYAVNDYIYVDGPQFYIAKKAHTADLDSEPPNPEYWQLLGGGLSGVYDVRLPFTFAGIEISPYRIIRVTRGDSTGWTECVEFSQQAVARTISGNPSFPRVNKAQLGKATYSTMFADNTGGVDGSIWLVFSVEFDPDEVVVIDYITFAPFRDDPVRVWEKDKPSLGIPEFLEEVVVAGLKWTVLERLFTKGDDTMQGRAERARQQWKNTLKEAVAYARTFRENRYGMTAQPYAVLGRHHNEAD